MLPNGFLTGAGYVVSGLRVLFRPRIRRYVVVPLVINSLLFAAGIFYAFAVTDALLDTWLPAALDWIRWVIWPVFALIALGTVFFGFALAANLLAAPSNGQLAGAVEGMLVDRPSELNQPWAQLPAEIAAALGAEFRKLLFFAVRAIPFLLLFLLAPPLAPICWFAYCAWALAHEYADYPLGNRGLLFTEQRVKLAQKRRLVLGFGTGVMVLTLIPVANFLAMPAAVAGATIMCLEQLND